MSAMASQITGVLIVCSTDCSCADQRKHQRSASLSFMRVTGGFPSQRASNAENVSFWWRHHVVFCWGLVQDDFTHILQDYIIDTGTSMPLKRPRQNGRHFADDILSTFSGMKMYDFQLKFHWQLFPRVQSMIFQHWFRQRLGTDQAISHYLN